ncbi:hypothetical protein MSA03_09100 [Microbacterium saccharophilum]|nr:hypothetical protein MSA03_09100 [Microbacterium saccharophilum]
MVLLPASAAEAFHVANVPAPPRRRATPAAVAMEALAILFMMGVLSRLVAAFSGGCGVRVVLPAIQIRGGLSST